MPFVSLTWIVFLSSWTSSSTSVASVVAETDLLRLSRACAKSAFALCTSPLALLLEDNAIERLEPAEL